MPVTEPISWSTAQRIAGRISGSEPFSTSYLAASFEADMVELSAQAEELVEAETGLVANGRARVRVTDRAGWANANVAAFQRLLLPLTIRLEQKLDNNIVSRAGRTATGAQLGFILGWMSTRVLGQYDLLLLEDQAPDDQDIVYYVGPNILSVEKRYAFPPREFRLWIALHECTHRAQFTGVPWLPGHFRSLVTSLLQAVDPDAKKVSESIKKVKDSVKAGDNPLSDGGLLAVLASPEQQDALMSIFGLMSLLEGHGEVIMSRAGQGLVPSAERFHRVMHERRTRANPLTKTMQKFLGMNAKMKQYAEGAKFVETLEKAGGAELFAQVWRAPEDLPTYKEIKDPQLWITRHANAVASA